MTGRLFAVVGPSGAGKDTLLAGAVAADPALHWARRVITRPETPGGEPYEGVSPDAFAARLAQGEFALHWQAHGLCYGIAHAELAPLVQGRDVLFNGSRAALPAAQAAFPGMMVVRISAPPDMLAARLQARGREGADDIAGRLARAGYDLPADLAVLDICNDDSPATGIARLLAALQAARGARCNK
jgi:ribose 1,5-bisphosphokinase